MIRNLMHGEPTPRSYRNLAYLTTAIALALAAVAALNVWLWILYRDANAKQEAWRRAQCQSSIVGTLQANQIVQVIRDDLYYRADLTQRIIDATPGDKANGEREGTVGFYRLKANALPQFTVPQCRT